MEQNRKIVLASASPRRKELLEKIGLKITVDPADFQEDMHPDLKPEGLAKYLSIGKAGSAARKYPDAIVIAADTFGVLRGKIIGKPGTADEARLMLMSLSGRSHRVITGFTIIDTAGHKSVTRVVETRVFIKQLSPMEILNYVKTGEPLDKAGAYAIQGLGALIVDKIVGDYYNVMGLPLKAMAESLREFGISVL
ncbi:MAG: septum formation protein Maf [Dehalococcoidales bacterium]|nr:septum formation protein Maf [Dehalococcoidales bacterium]